MYKFFLLLTVIFISFKSMAQISDKENAGIEISLSNKLSFEDYLQLMEERIYQWTFTLPEGKYKLDIYAEKYNSESSNSEKIILQPGVDYIIDVSDKKPVTLTLRLPSSKSPECKLLLKYLNNNGIQFSSNLSCCTNFSKIWLPTTESESFSVVCFNKPKILLNNTSKLLYISLGNSSRISFDKNNNIQTPVKISKQARIVLFCMSITMLNKG